MVADLDCGDAGPPGHGGDLYKASRRYGIELSQWLDLSTGVNPVSYPYGEIPQAALQRLPYLQPEFLAAAKAYYQTENILPVAGSQAAIYLLPQCLPIGKVLVPDIGYQEHGFTWQQAGAELAFYRALDTGCAVDDITTGLLNDASVQHLVIINPNNPTGICFGTEQIFQWATVLADRDGYIIVDEAFMDVTPEQSILSNVLPDNVIVLRSFGKFFGLAGIRLGFVVTGQVLLNKLEQKSGGWLVNGVAQSVAIEAFEDTEWQRETRGRLLQNKVKNLEFYKRLIEQNAKTKVNNMPLFTSLLTDLEWVNGVYEIFARCGVLTRVIPVDKQTSILRIGNIDFDNPAVVARVRKLVKACY